jgi:AraC-like DNA-binding protein
MPILSSRYDQEIITVLTENVLPWWEQFGLKHLVASANTLKEFRAQSLPESIQVSVKKRRGKKVAVHGPRYFENTSFKIAMWPEDGQETIRYPALACVLCGQADFHIADYVVRCPQKHFMLFNANVPQPNGHSPHFGGGDFARRYCEILWLLAPPAATNRISAWICYSKGDEHWIQQLSDYCLLERSETLTFYNTFIQEITQRPSGYREVAEISFQAFLRLLIRELSEGRFSRSAEGKGRIHSLLHNESDPIELAEQYIDYNLGKYLTTQSVADAVYMSRSSFIRRFQLETQQTFNEYLTTRRLEEARRLLSDEMFSVGIVCRLVGLSPPQLRNLFQKRYDTSPSQFRKNSKSKTN